MCVFLLATDTEKSHRFVKSHQLQIVYSAAIAAPAASFSSAIRTLVSWQKAKFGLKSVDCPYIASDKSTRAQSEVTSASNEAGEASDAPKSLGHLP
jgi:hypothetical protein